MRETVESESRRLFAKRVFLRVKCKQQIEEANHSVITRLKQRTYQSVRLVIARVVFCVSEAETSSILARDLGDILFSHGLGLPSVLFFAVEVLVVLVN